MIDVILCDDHRMMLEGLRATLHSVSETEGFKIVGTAGSFDELRPLYVDSSIVLVMDIAFKNESGNGLSFCKEVLEKDKNAKIVIFSQNDDEYCIQSAYKMGILGYVRKDEDESVLIESIKCVNKHQQYISPEISLILAKNSTSKMNPLRLTERQRGVFLLIADGFSKEEIAEQLNIGFRTVHTIAKEIKDALGISSDADFTKLAIKYGMIKAEIVDKNRT